MSDDERQNRLERCECEIAAALAESQRDHSSAEHMGILLWEMDWQAERHSLLVEKPNSEADSVTYNHL